MCKNNREKTNFFYKNTSANKNCIILEPHLLIFFMDWRFRNLNVSRVGSTLKTQFILKFIKQF